MLVDLVAMRRMHNVQYEMMIELQELLQKLNIKYYFVHGSLLGAVIKGEFIPEDDDIDIAIFRQDYNRLISEGNKFLKHYFIQSSRNDDFPLAFAKMRDTRTLFRQPVLSGYSCNQGIYIDIFPIDYVAETVLEKLKEKMLSVRLCSRLKNKSLFKRIVSLMSVLYCPSWKRAAIKREMLYSKRKSTKMVNVTNGKREEQCIPIEWFSEGVKFNFRGLNVNCPAEFDKYLSKIYGANYKTHNPAESRMAPGGLVEVSADDIKFL